MVAGSVTTPRLDLANEDLIRAHVHALWLAESGLDLRQSLSELLDISGVEPSLAVLESVLAHLKDRDARTRTVLRALKMLGGIAQDLQGCGWYDEHWLKEAVDDIPARFEDACERWRCLYRSAVLQRETQNAISCGCIHALGDGQGPDLCETCGSKRLKLMNNMFRMRNVATRRRDRISSDEEERLRFGYTLCTGFRFVEHGGMPSHRDSSICSSDGTELLNLKYGHGADLWRINLGWANRKPDQPDGFILNLDKGTWLKEGALNKAEEFMDEATGTGHIERVIPYVQDRKNCLLITPDPELALTQGQMYSLEAALKQSIQQLYQLEDNELACEALPAQGEPASLLFYESAEGGAGVLRRISESADAFPRIARKALEICHFDPDTGEDLHKAPHAAENCVVACYDCLMSYNNQRHHGLLDRHSIKALLTRLTGSSAAESSTAASRSSHLDALRSKCDSELERKWLDFVDTHGYRLPSDAQRRIEGCHTVADFFYEPNAAIYIDGPIHEYADRAQRDAEQEECLEDAGYLVLRFADWEQWSVTLDKHPDIFGGKK